ncbi:hypothetical protein [Massilia sp. erpn]|uniref:hypothetical protein n=1 Tax=Massilia sp. erpn TaxID=2738142 RepID=UPI0021020E33|nr:hypothetical protein [Massilia sp. erpn]UTY56028.1 hypothetical protein HPQ68_01780 [Massilia sp. erpn]
MNASILMAALAAALFAAGAAQAQLQAMSDEELSHTRGQGLIALSNTRLGGFDFTRIALDADVTLNANLRSMRLGDYRYAAREGMGADIDIAHLQFGRSDGSAAQRLVQIGNPYFEFVYRDSGNAAAPREAVGMRFGFDSISGDIGMKINTLSGSLRVEGKAADGSAIALDSRSDALGGKRWDGSCSAPCMNFSQLGAVRAGDASGPSRDFWVSMLKTGVQFPAPPGTSQLPDMAQAGMWMNWRDKLSAINATGALPPNLPPGR